MKRVVLATMMAIVFTLSVWAQAPQTPQHGRYR